MKKVIACVAGLVMVASAPAWGQAKNFEGWGLGANLESLSMKYENSISIFGLSANVSQSTSESNLTLNGQYNFALGENWLVGFGLDLGASKNTAAVFGTLGYALSDTSMVYAKVSSETMGIATTLSSNGVSSDRNFNGVGLGIGYRGNLSKKMYWQIGLDSLDFDPVGDAFIRTKATSTRFSLGVGTRF